MRAWAVVAAYNERDSIDATVRALLSGVVERVLVVDDGSQDETAERAMGAGAQVLHLDRNMGKGAAVQAGWVHVLRDDSTSQVLLADADLGDSARGLGPLLDSLNQDGTDIAIASFSTRGGFGVAKRMAARGIRMLTGFEATSPLSGQRALTRDAVLRLGSLPSGWGIEVAMTVHALWRGMGVVEVPVDTLRHRESARDVAGFVHRGRQCLAVARALGSLACVRCLKGRPTP